MILGDFVLLWLSFPRRSIPYSHTLLREYPLVIWVHVHDHRSLVEGRAFAHRPAPSAMADRCYDLTEKLGGFLDRHMSLPLLDFLIAKGIYAPAELEQGKLEVLFSTNMVDLAVDIYTARKEKPPAAMLARREEVVASMNALSAEVQPILEIVQDAVRRARRETWLGLAWPFGGGAATACAPGRL